MSMCTVGTIFMVSCMCLQGYAGREFVKLGVQPGELTIFSKEAVCAQPDATLWLLVFQILLSECLSALIT